MSKQRLIARLWAEYSHAIDERESWADDLTYGSGSSYAHEQWVYWSRRADELGARLAALGE